MASHCGSSERQPGGDSEEIGTMKTAVAGDALTGSAGASPTEYYCGVWKYRPKWLQVFRNAYFFTFILCLDCFIEGAIVSGFTSIVLSSIERRYQFSSVAAGTIAASFDVGVLLSVLFISYFGGRSHKPRLLGVGLIVQGIGAFIFTVPQYIFGRYEITNSGSLQYEACLDDDDFSSDCEASTGGAVALFVLGELLIGIGAAPLFTVGTSYLDDIVSPKKVSIHLGLFYALTVIGPALGYGLGGAFLTVFVDPWAETTLEPTDPGWVGAWWIGFLLSSAISFLLSIPFLMFPRLLPDSHLVKAEREKDMAKSYKSKFGEKEETDFGAIVKSFPTHLKQIFSNLAWLTITAAVTVSIIVISGMVSFAPKYLESQFGLTASRASLIAGAVAIPAGGCGVVVGGLILFFSKAKGRKVVLVNWIVSLLIVFPILGFLVSCPTVNLAGLTVPYADGSQNEFYNSSCTAPCNCTSAIYEPVCGKDGLTYFSPCRAGCDVYFVDEDRNKPVFENCSCVQEMLLQQQAEMSSFSAISDSLLVNSTASDGRCRDSGCSTKLGLFIAIMAVALFLIFILQIPNVVITIRCVADVQRTISLGVQSFIFRMFGSIPGPILFGLIFDSACLDWQDECGRRGSCWVYENKHLSQRALSLALTGSALNFVFVFLCWLVYPKQQSDHEKGEQDKSVKELEGSTKDRDCGGVAWEPEPELSLTSKDSLLMDTTVEEIQELQPLSTKPDEYRQDQ